MAISGMLWVTAGAGQAGATSLPFVGHWTCGIGRVSFTETSYNPGDRELRISAVESEGETFNLSLDEAGVDVGQLFLAMNPDGSMTGYSPISGDSFLCHPLP